MADHLLLMTGTAAAVGLGALFVCRYKISSANQYVVKTGLGIDRVHVSKNTFVWPLQRAQIVDINPRIYNLSLKAMSREKVPFLMPANFTIAPDSSDAECLAKYANNFVGLDDDEMHKVIEGVIEGETRSVASNMTLIEIFNDRVKFKNEIKDTVEVALKGMGLVLKNANIKELQDEENSKYFEFLRQRTIEGASNQAKVEVAEAESTGTQGQKWHTVAARKMVAQLEAEAVQIENEKSQEIAVYAADLEKIKIEQQQQISIAQIAANASVALKEQELQIAVEQKRLEQNTEALRAKERKRLQGLSPKYTIWNTNNGSSSADGKANADPIQDIMKKLPPLLTTIQQQTGITPPEWLIKMKEHESL